MSTMRLAGGEAGQPSADAAGGGAAGATNEHWREPWAHGGEQFLNRPAPVGGNQVQPGVAMGAPPPGQFAGPEQNVVQMIGSVRNNLDYQRAMAGAMQAEEARGKQGVQQYVGPSGGIRQFVGQGPVPQYTGPVGSQRQEDPYQIPLSQVPKIPGYIEQGPPEWWPSWLGGGGAGAPAPAQAARLK